MGESEDMEDSTYSRHQDLCQKLNMDATAASEAWRSYETIRQNYTLEGDQLHWIGCALYVACRKSSTPTVGRTGSNVEGNGVSLTRLLQLCNLPLIQFFTKSKSWADMASMPQDFREKIDKLEGNFSVSMVIFKKYQPIFTDIFKDPSDDISRPSRSRRNKSYPCTPSRVFEFCWTLFICIKGAFPDISDDLVNSYHLLLACCDLIYANALMANRKDLLNPNFPGLPGNFNDENYIPPQNPNCIINLLCERHEAVAVEAKCIKEYHLKNHINKLFNERILRGEQSNFSGILEASNFDGNSKAVNKTYEQYVLSVGDFDERIFLGQDASDNIGSPAQGGSSSSDVHDQFQSRRDHYTGQMQHLAPPTPLTGRKYLKPKDVSSITPVFTATQSVIRLQAMLAGQSSPSANLLQIFNNCTQDVKTFVTTKVKEIGEQFCANYTKSSDTNENTTLDFGRKRLCLGQTLFYKFLEMIINDEKHKKPNYDITNLLMNERFIRCLFACCLEIVIYSYKSNDKMFPWILKALDLEAYYFYKVIEIIVRAEEQLPRDVVKHLSQTEERILEALAWKKNSPLWQAIESTIGEVPSCEDVSLPGTLEIIEQNNAGQPILKRITVDRSGHNDVPQSPISSASDRFQSPITASGIAKKRLFPDTRSTGQSVLRVSSKVVIDGNSRILLTLPDQLTVPKTSTPQATINVSQSSSITKEAGKPKKTGSVALFFRKFYNLACVRMQDLCNSLDITDIDLQKKIWTIFEYSIKERTELMRDRHLDQILMCAVYVICKLVKMEKNSFTEIMRCYRLQPQAESHIYRSVLICKGPQEIKAHTEASGSNDIQMDEEANVAPPTPTNMAGTSQDYGTERRGDLIKFYNTVYVPQVKEVANKLGLARGSTQTLTLSPLPKSKVCTNSPVRRVTDSILTRTLDIKAMNASPAPQLSYCFSRSPAKDLEAINKMMISISAKKIVNKRLLSDDTTDVEMTDGGPSPIKKSTTVVRKLENIMDERRTKTQ
ncbi:PREDICTED: retinoblastoma-like protein 1 isoform X2 [Polistes dominula]|uniref:Retinoblastoma-like protein 1 isoform X2 n=1 Tax=Polistes dominula TaxID=743375 RepID=A0ABM1HVN0_POLDO|nr:PREDICTED: retinoblastoma-like protein 1 isoform X2 [Polistes dominula]